MICGGNMTSLQTHRRKLNTRQHVSILCRDQGLERQVLPTQKSLADRLVYHHSLTSTVQSVPALLPLVTSSR